MTPRHPTAAQVEARAAAKLEVHEHTFTAGRRANGGCYGRDGKWLTSTFSHSHEGGDVSHTHPDTGPSSYKIDKDEWLALTGLVGGGRKKFTAKPTGEQMPMTVRTEEEQTFEIIFSADPTGGMGEATGGGYFTAARMVLAFGMRAKVRSA